jgi:iterative type I PKS product template protein
LGEYAAFVIAGVLSLSDALLLVVFRASLMAKLCASDSTGMLAVNASAKEVDRLLNMKKGELNDLSVACRNSPNHTVVSGSLNQTVLLRTVLKQMSIKSKQLDVPFAYHSPAMHPIKEPLDQFASKIKLSPPKIPLGLNLFGRLHSLGDLDHRYFSSQSISPVRFQEVMEDSFTKGELDSTAVIEMGPHPTTLPLISAALPQTAALYLASLQRTEDSWVSISKALTELTLRDSKINWREVYHGTNCGLVDFPIYPFAQDEFRVPYRAHHSDPKALGGGNDLADKQQQNSYSLLSSSIPTLSSGHGSVYRSTVATIAPLIDGHRVTGLSLCPASVYVELALEAAQSAAPLTEEESYVIQEITFPIPLVGDAQSTKQIDVTITATDTPGEFRFQITSHELDSEEGKTAHHCKGLLKSQMNDYLRTRLSNRASFINEEDRPSAAGDVPCTVVNRRMLYETIFPRVVAYSLKYQSIQWLEISDDGMEGRGTFRLQKESLIEKCVSQPVFADTLLHAAGFLANCSVSTSDVCICAKVEEVTLLADSIDSSATYSLYSFISQSGPSTVLGKSFAFDSAGRVVASIQGMHFRRLPQANFKHHLQSSWGERSNLSPSSLQSQNGAIIGIGSDERVSEPNCVPRSKILQIIAELTGITDERIIESMTFDELGIDSMMMIEFMSELKVQLPHIDGVPQSAIISCSSLSDLEACLGASPASSLSVHSLPDLVYTDTSNVSPAVARSPQNVTMTNSDSMLTLQILDAIAQVTGVRRELVKEDSDLEALGLDSLMSIELLQAFEAQHGVRISSDAFASCKSPHDVEMLTQSTKISAGISVAVERTLPGDDELSRSLTLLQSGPEEKTPVYLLHDGSGSSSAYGRLTPFGRNMYGVSSPTRADAKRSPQTIQEMAAKYATLLDTSGRIILGGVPSHRCSFSERNRTTVILTRA